jgi:hypothetical protein
MASVSFCKSDGGLKFNFLDAEHPLTRRIF